MRLLLPLGYCVVRVVVVVVSDTDLMLAIETFQPNREFALVTITQRTNDIEFEFVMARIRMNFSYGNDFTSA